MSGPLRQLGRHTLIYTAGIIIGKIASFVMLPVYTRFLTPADYGVLELLGMTIDVIGMITSVGIVAGVFKFYSEDESQTGKNAVISTAALSAVGLAGATCLFGFFLSPVLTETMFGPQGNPLYLRLYFLIYFIQTFEYLPFLLIRAENRSVLFVTLNAAKLVATLSLNILFVVYLRMGIEGVLISTILATSASALALSAYMIARVGLRFSTDKFRQMLRFGSAIVPWAVANFILVFSDRFFLNHYLDTTAVGIYSLAYKFAFLLSILAYSPFETVWAAQRFEIAKRPDAQEVFARVFLYLNVVLGVLALVLCLFIRDFLSVMSSPAFLPAYKLVPLLISAQVIFVWAAYWSTGIYISGRTRVMASGSLFVVAITLLLNFLLIPKLGGFGAAWATLGAYAARFSWIYFFSQRYYPIRYSWSELAKLYGVFGVAVALTFAYRPATMAASLAWSTIILIISVGVAYAAVLGPDDRARLKSLLYPSDSASKRAGQSHIA